MSDAADAARLTDRVAALVDAAKKAGADAADAVAVRGPVNQRFGQAGQGGGTNSSEGDDVSLQGLRRASASPAFRRRHRRIPTTLAERAVAMAKVSPEDPYQGLADAELLAKTVRDLDLYDGTAVSADELRESALAAEEAALAGARRDEFGRQRRQRRPRRAGARHLAWLRRPLSSARASAARRA